jgi:predicted Zn-dependent protease
MLNGIHISLKFILCLVDAYTVAFNMGFYNEALKILSALEAIFPDLPHPVMNQSIVLRLLGNVSGSIDVLYDLKKKFPNNQLVKATLGQSLAWQNDKRAQVLLAEVLQDGSDIDAIAIARASFDLINLKPKYNINAMTSDLEFIRHYTTPLNG